MAARKHRSKKKMPEIPVASFSDIAFLLLIFFILTTSFHKTQGFLSELPSGQVSKSTAKGETPTVVIGTGVVKYNDEPVTMPELRVKLAGLKLAEREKPEDKIVMMESASGVAYEDYYQVMAAISSANGVIAIVKEDSTKR
jgi:biopolymer transport protein ExbD